MLRRLLALLLGLLPLPAAALDPAMLVIAHRGASGLAPENTLAAVRAAIDTGADGIEFDVQLSADGHPVVYHDLTLNPDLTRLDGQWLDKRGPAIRTLTLAELQRYDVGRVRPGSKAAQRYPDQQPADGERIPTLAAVLALVKERAQEGFQLWIELKTDPTNAHLSADPHQLADAVRAVLEEAAMTAQATVISFHWEPLLRLARAAPPLRLGFNSIQAPSYNTIAPVGGQPSPWTAPVNIADHGGSVPRAVAAAGAAAWSVFLEDLTPAHRAEARDLGLAVAVWTVRRKGQMRTVARLAPDAVITDRPDWFTRR